MFKKAILTTITLLAALLPISAQAPEDGAKGTVIDRADRSPVANASIEIIRDGKPAATISADADGRFYFSGYEDGNWTLLVSAPGYLSAQVNIAISGGVRDLFNISLSPTKAKDLNEDSSDFAEFDLADTGYSDSPTVLFSNDVYSNIVGYSFSSVRFKNRGYNSETQDVLLGGVKLNDAITGYSPWSLWSGLNEVTRSKATSNSLEASDYALGGYNGVTNIYGNPSNMRKGLRASVLTNSAMYRMRLMLTYASGQRDDGWSYAFSASARFGNNDWVQGVFYRSLAYYLGVEKKFGDEHSLALFHFATPGMRGTQNASTQEVYDLMGDNMYNSNWGYQNGKRRNSRMRKTFEPITVLKYDFTPSDKFSSSTTLLWRTGLNGYTALDWYDAQDPRPDYYRNLPSFAYIEEEDIARDNPEKAEWMRYAWTASGSEYEKYRHLDWDRLYNVNANNADGRSKYAQEERHVDQNDINLSERIKWRISDPFTLTAGLTFRWNRTENYKKMADLLGGQYFLNIDSFAERDFAISEAKIQNDLDYWVNHGEAEKVVKGGKYGYDYLAQVRRANLWANCNFVKGNFFANLGVSAGYDAFWREGLVRKGLFAGTDDYGRDIVIDGVNLTTRDADGKVVSSKGKSEVSRFFVYSAKASAGYSFVGGHRIWANAGFFNDAPTFNEAFISPRTRNTLVKGLTTKKTFSTDINYQLSTNGYSAKLSLYYTNIWDQSDVMSFYDDSQNSFTNFAMTGISQRHLGLELGVSVPLPVQGLSISGVLSLGQHVYTSTPHMTQTIDNSAEVIRDEDVTWWDKTPQFKIAGYTAEGMPIYDRDIEGNFIITGYDRHHVAGSPQLAAEIALNYTIKYWYIEVNGQYFDWSYLDMNPLYRTSFACRGSESNPGIIREMTAQERFDPAFLLNASVGKSWFVKNRQIGFSLSVNNILNNRGVKTGGYEQTRLISSTAKDRYYRFDSKYFYMPGINYMLNVYFRF
ncbi:MAG: carboxypeptidase regulatory-like domain-containing protein [Bacteroidales bacterium]|nr:carboxypeptidase regulatory-like domain-containing protein [Bacteroidales bacterium]